MIQCILKKVHMLSENIDKGVNLKQHILNCFRKISKHKIIKTKTLQMQKKSAETIQEMISNLKENPFVMP